MKNARHWFITVAIAAIISVICVIGISATQRTYEYGLLPYITEVVKVAPALSTNVSTAGHPAGNKERPHAGHDDIEPDKKKRNKLRILEVEATSFVMR